MLKCSPKLRGSEGPCNIGETDPQISLITYKLLFAFLFLLIVGPSIYKLQITFEQKVFSVEFLHRGCNTHDKH